MNKKTREARNRSEALRYAQEVINAIEHDKIKVAALWSGELTVVLGMLLESRGENQLNDDED